MKSQKEIELNFIKEFSKISIADICKDLKVDKSNLYRGNASATSVTKVKDEIIKRYNFALNNYFESEKK